MSNPKTKMWRVRVNDDLNNKLEKLASIMDKPKQYIIRVAIEDMYFRYVRSGHIFHISE